MTYIIVGLGNPGPDYEQTRHNTGRMVLEYLQKEKGFSAWENRKELKARISEGELNKDNLLLVEPDNYMNNSGKSLEKLVKNSDQDLHKWVKSLIVVYDDIDLPLGKLRISFDRGSGGHRGVESIIKSIKTRAFIRVRIGITPMSPSGVIKKPKGEVAVERHILKKFTKSERIKLDPVIKDAASAIETIICSGLDVSMRQWN